MTLSKSRIPVSILSFNTYIETTNDYLIAGSPETNAARLGILDTEQQSWSGFRDEWAPLFPQYENKRSSRTLLIIDRLHTIIRKMKAYDKEHHILNRIAASPNVTVTDLSTFNIKSGPLAKQNRTRPSQPIDILVVPDIKQIGGGELSIKCRNNVDTRIAIVDDANGVEFLYLAGEEAPSSVNDQALRRGFSSRARLMLELGGENKKKTAYLYFRWINSKYPSLAGPWSTLYSATIV